MGILPEGCYCLIALSLEYIGRKQIIFTAFWSKVLDFFYNWYIDSVCEDKALHQVRRQNVN